MPWVLTKLKTPRTWLTIFLGGAQIHLQKMAAWGPLYHPGGLWFVLRGTDSSCGVPVRPAGP